MIGLVDCNNFYASCEQVFDPALVGRPVVVLSNNDGCIIARSAAAKKIGLKMGQPAFQIRHLLEQHQVVIRSSNYTIYGDLSNRVMNTLRQFSDEVEVYSIDEAFVSLSTGRYQLQTPEACAQSIRQTVGRSLGLPVAIGISLTKTLAKIANHLAKKHDDYIAAGVCVLEEKQIGETLDSFPIAEVWGIGRRYAQWLYEQGVSTAGQFCCLPEHFVKAKMSVVGQRLWRELQGESCLELELVSQRRKNICTSRTFGTHLTDLGELHEPVATFAERCAKKLRGEGSMANVVTVFIQTDRYRQDWPQYARSLNIPLPYASQSFEIARAALAGLRNLYRTGYHYRKAGVIVSGLVPHGSQQTNLFVGEDPRSQTLTEVMDQINVRYGSDTVRLGAAGTGRRWRLKAERRSPRYTTRYDEIPVFRAG